MKKLKPTKKLVLNTETLASLTTEQTMRVIGGADDDVAAVPQLTRERTQYLCTCNCPA